jgi:hypothetical protein
MRYYLFDMKDGLKLPSSEGIFTVKKMLESNHVKRKNYKKK